MTPDPAGMAAVDPANPQSWNRYAYVMNNPLNATDPLGLCYFGDGATIGVSGPRDPGLECGTGALDSSNPGGCMTDASCSGTPVGPGPDPAGTPDSYFESFIAQSHAQTFARYQNRADCGYNPGTCDTAKPTDYTILVTCGGTFGAAICVPPAQSADGSLSYITHIPYPGLAPGDIPAGAMAQQLFQGNRSTWNGAYQVGEGTAIGLAIVTAPFTLSTVGSTAITASTSLNTMTIGLASTAETYGIPVSAISIWVNKYGTNAFRVARWMYKEYQEH